MPNSFPQYPDFIAGDRKANKDRERAADLDYQLQINRALLDNAVSGLFLIDGDSRIVSMNIAAEKATGYGLEESKGRKLHDLIHSNHLVGKSHPGSRCPFESVLATGSIISNSEERFVKKEGEIFPAFCSIVPLNLGRLKSCAVVEFQVLAKGKEGDAELRRSEERYRRLFETAQDGILILDAEEGHIHDANPFILELLGYTREELIGKQLWEIGLFRDIEANHEAFETLKDKGYIRYEDLPLKTKAGLKCEVEFVSNIYPVGYQNVIQCNIRDITERKSTANALYLSEEKLRQSRKLQAIGELSGGIAHDFNNLLTVINGYTEMALSMVEPEGTLYGHMSQIQKAGERASGLTQQLLSFSRQQILAPKVIGLNSVISDMQTMLAMLVGDSIHILFSLDPDLGRVKADLVQMQQILLNLVINARDSMPAAGEIAITTGNRDLDGEYAANHPEVNPKNYVMLSVLDTGTGMNAEVKARIFDPFFTTKEPGKGTGMGLATVQGIVEQSGGHITVESSPGKGSELRIYLPRTNEEAEDLIGDPAAKSTGDQGSETILLAEDDAMVRSFIRTALELYGYTVLEVENGTVALALIQTHAGDIDLLLTDLRMPSLNGQELARNFLQMRPNGHVLFMSGYTDDTIDRQGMVEAGERFIQKPFSAVQLARAMREVLDRIASKAG